MVLVSKMNINKLKSLMYVAELGSVSAAASAMHLTQAAVSQQLKDLEEEMGLSLVDRSLRPVSLTKDGEELVAVTRQMLRPWNEYKDRKRNVDLGGELVIGHVRSAVTGTIANSLAFLRTKHPRLKIRLVVGGGVTKALGAGRGQSQDRRQPRRRAADAARGTVVASLQPGAALCDRREPVSRPHRRGAVAPRQFPAPQAAADRGDDHRPRAEAARHPGRHHHGVRLLRIDPVDGRTQCRRRHRAGILSVAAEDAGAALRAVRQSAVSPARWA